MSRATLYTLTLSVGHSWNLSSSIYDYTESLIKKKRMPRYSMKQIEQIVHESRHSRG
jgi:hypothetical protein